MDLIEQLRQEPHRWDFFQAVRLLERLLREQDRDGERPARAPIGQDGPPNAEWGRFRSLAALSFPGSPVVQVTIPTAATGQGRAELSVAFLGLTGPNGALPQHYTEMLLRRLRDKDQSLRDWLDLFNHRLISLFYRAWEKYRLPFTHERFLLQESRRADDIDLPTHAVYCLIGMGTPGQRGRQAVPDEAFLFYAGHFAHYPRSAAALESILEDYLGLPVQVQQMQGEWLVLGVEDRARMPGPGVPRGRNNLLGDLVVGQRVWDVQSKFRIRIGPVGYDQFRRLMPGGDRLQALCQLVRTYVGPDLEFDIQPVLRAAEVPPCSLGPPRSRVGWNTWVISRTPTRDAQDAVFRSRDPVPVAR